MKRFVIGALAVIVVATTACGDGSGEGPSDTAAKNSPGDLQAQVASYDLRAGTPQRFLLGLLTGEGRLVGGGELRFEFAYVGTKAGPAPAEPGFEVSGTYRLVAGQPGAEVGGAGLVEPGGPAGVYGSDNVEFPKAGFWRVTVPVQMDGKDQRPSTTFEVKDDSTIPYVGEPGPRSQNHVIGSTEVPPKAIDSRAGADGSIPDPELHSLTVDQSVASGKPTLVVVSTPTYCVSRFCGPITERVQALAGPNQRAMNFIHLEVWKDFEAKAINKAAAEWIYPTKTEDATEPWVFVLDGSGVITHRFDNIATDSELESAVNESIS